MTLMQKVQAKLSQKGEVFLILYYIPVIFLLGLDLLAYSKESSFPLFYWPMVLLNIVSVVAFLRWRNFGILGIFICSFLLLCLPSEYVGNSSTSLFVLYPLVYMIFRGQWLSVLLAISSYGLSVYVGASDADFSKVLGHLVILLINAVPAGLFFRVSALRNEHARAEVLKVRQRTMDHLSMAVHDTVLTTLTRELLRIRELAASTDDASVYTELMSIEEGLRATSRSLRQVFNATESPDVQPESFDVLHADIDLLARTSSHPLHLENEVSDLEELLTRDQYRFLLLMLREGVVNATKYAPRHSEISLDISQSAEGIEASVVSAMPENISADRSLSSGIGLENLRKRAELLGLDFYSGPVCGQWLHTLSIPSVEDACADTVGKFEAAESEPGDGQ